MVFAIGIVVDDAIVVIENVERNMHAFGLGPREAARRAMDEVTGPVIAIVLVLSAVFIPMLEPDKELDIARRTLDTRKESLRIPRLRFDAGLTSEMDRQQAQVEYQSTLIQIPRLEAAIVQYETAIALLLGENPTSVARGGTLDRLPFPRVPVISLTGLLGYVSPHQANIILSLVDLYKAMGGGWVENAM